VVVRGQAAQDDPETFFELKIRPVLAGTCFKCHGGQKTSSGLRVDSRDALLRGGETGPAVVPGQPDESLLVQAIRYTDADLHMPPDRRLPDPVAADFARWVAEGAAWPRASSKGTDRAFQTQQHWAFEPVRARTPPADPSGWSEGPIDRFVAARQREARLRPVEPADRRTLIRRLSFDLTGLPPMPHEVAAFLADESPTAWEQVVDRLLASPRFGERWGRHWMDVAHYADTAGDNADYPIPEVRLYRDYIIDAFNADKPYDEFVREQLAGDLIARQGPRAKYAERVVATGFLALSRRYATAPFELWHLTLEDTIETTGSAFLGLTLRCARCHDHKFDPVTTKDYYALYGIFASTTFPYAGSEELNSRNFPRSGFVPLVPPDEAEPKWNAYRNELKRLESEIASGEKNGPLAHRVRELDQQIAHLRQQTEQAPGDDAVADVKERKQRLEKLTKERERAQAELKKWLDARREELRRLQRPGLPPGLPGSYAVTEGKPTRAHVQLKGEPGSPGPEVPRGVPRFLAGSPPPAFPDGASGRLQFAEWLTRPDHPLTARVMVNRIWQHLFGKGIVPTPSNFGLRGEPPSHPELLDWLAREFVARGWSVKAIVRLIVLSKSYRLSSRADAHDLALDPGNARLWRHDRRQLDAESIRDAWLAVSGRLDPARPGPHPFPPIEQWRWSQHKAFRAVYPSDYRSVYLMTQRLQRHPYLALFDGPDTNHSTDVRSRSTVPLQALYFMNNAFVREQAEGLAKRLIVAATDPRERIGLAYERAWGRPPQPDETAKALAYIENYGRGLSQAGAPAGQVEIEAWTSHARLLLTANEFLYVD
jgi:hypothetical protein